MANIGMMEGAYFVGRVELLNWLNDLLKLDYTKVEQACTGAAHCQIMDAIYPGKVPLSKVKFDAKHEYEWVNNFKVLQNVFDKQGLDKHIDVQKLVKGKYQDNLEFFQWIKRYFDLNYSGGEYNAVERRSQAMAASGGPTKSAAPTLSSGVKKAAAPAPAKKAATEAPKKTTTTTTSTVKTSTKSAAAPSATKTKAAAPASKTPEAKSSGAASSSSASDSRVKELTQTIAELKVTVDGLEKERDFYFGKLQQIESLCNTVPEEERSEVLQQIFPILYATDEAEEFVAGGEEEEGGVEEGVEEQVEEEIESF